MSEYVMVRRDVLRARLRQLETVIAADNDDHDALADVRGWMETVLSQSSACKVCGGGGYVIADPPDGVGAMSNTPESAKRSREMLPEYRSASCDDVARAVDREMAYRDQLAAKDAEIEAMREALLKIADWNSAYGPYPEANNEYWGPMAIITAREATREYGPPPLSAALSAKEQGK